jgi:hypothetical protein
VSTVVLGKIRLLVSICVQLFAKAFGVGLPRRSLGEGEEFKTKIVSARPPKPAREPRALPNP